jgi:hypothetical protein
MSSLVLRIAKDDNTFKLAWQIPEGDEVWAPSAYSIDAADSGLLQQAAIELRRQMRSIAFAAHPFEKSEFKAILQNLAAWGQDLFLHLMPPLESDASDLRPRLEEIGRGRVGVRQDFKIVIETPELFVPWGFVFSGRIDDLPQNPTLSLADMQGFWLSQFNISVAYGSSSFPRNRKASSCKLIALHEEMFGKARRAIGDEECLSRLDQLLSGKMAPTMDWIDFEKAWKEVKDEYDSVLYVYGHSNGQRIQLRDTEKDKMESRQFDLPASRLIQFRKRDRSSASIFLLNGCETVAPSADSADAPISANFLKETRSPGYYGFVGTETQISNIFACRYGTEFLWRLCQERRSVGETFDELLESPQLFPQNLLYSCYADRGFRFTSNSDEK